MNPQYTTRQTTSQHSGSGRENPANYEIDAIRETFLKWSSIGEGQEDVVIHGESDASLLRNMKNILLGLQT